MIRSTLRRPGSNVRAPARLRNSGFAAGRPASPTDNRLAKNMHLNFHACQLPVQAGGLRVALDTARTIPSIKMTDIPGNQ